MPQEKRNLLVLLFSSLIVIAGTALLFYQKPAQKVKEEREEQVEDNVRYKISLTIFDGKNEQTLTTKVDSKDSKSLYDLMEVLRNEDKLKYDITNYTYGEVVDSINGLDNSGDAHWVLYVNDQTELKDLKHVNLKRGYVYKWSYEEVKK